MDKRLYYYKFHGLFSAWEGEFVCMVHLRNNLIYFNYIGFGVFRRKATLRYIFWPLLEARKCRAAQGPHSEVVPRFLKTCVEKL